MEWLKNFFESFFGAAGASVAVVFFVCFMIGPIYWLWISIQLGSFLMFFLGIAGPFVLFTGPVGFYSLIFGTPNWVINMFG